MDVTFRPRTETWVGQFNGRAPERCPAHLLELVKAAAAAPDQLVVLDVTGSTGHERRRLIVLLKRGGADLGVTVQARSDSSEIRFYVEAPDEQA